jgi:hypothetical protein
MVNSKTELKPADLELRTSLMFGNKDAKENYKIELIFD